MSLAKKATRTILCAVLALLLLAGSPLTLVRANADTQQQIDDLKEELKKIEEEAQAQQDVIDGLEENKALVVDRKLAMDARIDLTLRQIDLINQQVEIYNGIIAEKEEELNDALETEQAQSELLRSRMRTMEENGNYSYISFVFESDSFSDLLSRLADVDDIMHYDRSLEQQYVEARENAEAVKLSYEETRAQQEDLIKELDSKKAELDAQRTAATELIANISQDSDNAQAEYDAIAKVRDETEAEIDELLRKLAEEEAARKAAEEAARRAAAAAAQPSGGGGTAASGGGTTSGGSAVSLSSLMWPCPGVNIITSRFGPRISPTAGATSYHGGLDIGAGEGTGIVAAESGTVILAGANGGYGNCVMINHGNGIVTLYGHMSAIYVSNGQNVSKGQSIGAVGSTGIVTGPHLHFEIRVNGAQTDPAPYFGGLVYYC